MAKILLFSTVVDNAPVGYSPGWTAQVCKILEMCGKHEITTDSEAEKLPLSKLDDFDILILADNESDPHEGQLPWALELVDGGFETPILYFTVIKREELEQEFRIDALNFPNIKYLSHREVFDIGTHVDKLLSVRKLS